MKRHVPLLVAGPSRVRGGVAVLLAVLALQRAIAAGGVVTVGMTVDDMDRSLAFYTGVLDFRVIDDVELAGESWERLQGVFGLRMRVCRLQLGDEVIELTDYLSPESRPFPEGSRSNDRWFQHIAIITSDMGRAYGRLRANNVRHASSGPQRLPDWNPDAGGIEAFYFKDPDGHVLEILRFPPGKGDPKWHRRPDASPLFLGIDHTAIVVADTEQSLAFYRDTLGMTVAGTSENWGTEQEHLNNVFGARLRITSLRFPAAGPDSLPGTGPGPAIELLEYLAPTDGRPYPADARASDLVHWQVTIATNDLRAGESQLRAARARFISPGVVELTADTAPTPFTAGLTARDPDGHVVRIVTERCR